jgi:hypothetical protein
VDDILRLPEPEGIIDDFVAFIEHYEKHNIKICAVALGPSEYLRMCAHFMKQVEQGQNTVFVQQVMGKKIFVKTEPGMSAILHDNKDVF